MPHRATSLMAAVVLLLLLSLSHLHPVRAADASATCIEGLCAPDTSDTPTQQQQQQQQPKMAPSDLIALEKRPASTPPLSPQSWFTLRFVDRSLDGVAGASIAYGRADAMLKVFVFVDFACPVCVRAAEPIKHLMRHYAPAASSVQLVLMNLALESHRTALPAAVCGLAAARQGRYWEMFDQLVKAPFRDTEHYKLDLAHKSGIADVEAFRADLKDPMLAAQVRYESALANAVGITGTPGFWVGTRSLNGWASYFMFEQMVQQALEQANRIRASASAAELASDADLIMKRLVSSHPASATFAKHVYGIGVEEEAEAEARADDGSDSR